MPHPNVRARGWIFSSYCWMVLFVIKIHVLHGKCDKKVVVFILREKQQQPQPQLLLINGQFITLYLCDYILCVSTLGKWLKSMWKCAMSRRDTQPHHSQSLKNGSDNGTNYENSEEKFQVIELERTGSFSTHVRSTEDEGERKNSNKKLHVNAV